MLAGEQPTGHPSSQVHSGVLAKAIAEQPQSWLAARMLPTDHQAGRTMLRLMVEASDSWSCRGMDPSGTPTQRTRLRLLNTLYTTALLLTSLV